MSTIKTDTIVASDGTSPVTLTKQSAAKVWANIDGTGTVNLRDSFGCSSVTDSATAHYTLSFSSSMSNSNYSAVASGNVSIGNSGRAISCPATTNSSSQVGMKCFRSDNLAAEDFDFAMSQINGDLA